MSAKKILVVESNRPIEGLSAALFRRRECVLDVASSGAEALAIAEQSPPDLVILDALVDDYSPADFAGALHSGPAGDEVPVLVLLDEDSTADPDDLRDAGASAVLNRPASEIDLNVAVCELLGISLRRHVRTFVKMKVDATVGQSTHFATIANISLGGVLVQSEHPIRLGEIIKLSFFLPGDDDSVSPIARVVREVPGEDGGYGCEFLDLSESARRRIHDFVTSSEGDD